MPGPLQPDSTPTRQKKMHTITDRDTLKLFVDDLRSRIVQAIANEPRTIQQVAHELGLRSANLYYHFQMLIKHGLIVIVTTRQLTGAVQEHHYQAVAPIYQVDPAILTMADLTDEELVLIERIQRTLGSAHQEVLEAPDIRVLEHYHMNLVPEQASQFEQRLTDLIEEFTRNNSQADERAYGLTVAFYVREAMPE